MQNLIRMADAQEVLNRCRQTVHNRIRAGLLHPVKIGGRLYFDRAEVERLAAERQNRRARGEGPRARG